MTDLEQFRSWLHRANIPHDEFTSTVALSPPSGRDRIDVVFRLDDLELHFERATGHLIESIDLRTNIVRTTNRPLRS